MGDLDSVNSNSVADGPCSLGTSYSGNRFIDVEPVLTSSGVGITIFSWCKSGLDD